MAEMPATMEVPYETDLKCPVCEETIQVIAVVDVSPGKTHYSGSPGFHQKNFSVSLKTDISKFKIEHECNYVKPKEN